MITRKVRITRKQYELLGGMANSRLFRKSRSDGYWSYWMTVDILVEVQL